MNLYKLYNGLGHWFVIAKSYDSATKLLETELNKADYGFFDKRKVTKIELFAELIEDSFQAGQLNFSSGHTLIIEP